MHDLQTRRVATALAAIEAGHEHLARRLLAVVCDRYREAVAR